MTGIKEYQALLTLMQTYQSQMSMVYAASIGLAIGLFIVPLFALGSSLNLSPAHSKRDLRRLNQTRIFGLKERLVCFAITLMLAVGAVYCTNKTIFLGALQWETLIRLDVTDTKKSLMEYHIQMKDQLRDKYPILKKYRITHEKEATLKRDYKLQLLGFNALAMVGVLILFSFIWWRYRHFLWYLLGSELTYGLSIWLVLRYIPIM